MGRKVAILGTASDCVEAAPVGQEGWEIWGCSSWFQGQVDPAIFSRFFEFHALSTFSQDERKLFIPWLAALKCPVYVFDNLGIENQVFYPREAIEKSACAEWFLSSTIAWELALALHEHQHGQPIETIGVFGVNMATDSEYGRQKPGCQHFLSVARMLGIGIQIPRNSELHKTPLSYPFGHETAFCREVDLKIAYAEDALAKLEQARKVAEAETNYHRGQLDVLLALKRTVIE